MLSPKHAIDLIASFAEMTQENYYLCKMTGRKPTPSEQRSERSLAAVILAHIAPDSRLCEAQKLWDMIHVPNGPITSEAERLLARSTINVPPR